MKSLPLPIVFAALVIAVDIGACAGGPPKTSLELKVKVDPGACQEDRAGGGLTELVELVCKTSGEAAIRVEFPRKEWTAMRARLHDASVPDEHPGK